MGTAGTPLAEHEIDEPLVRALLREQYPDFASKPIQAVGEGWDNALFRIGETLAMRLPRRAASAPLIEKEQQWLPQLAPGLPLAIPVPVHIGRPGCGYPWSWSIVPWLRGTPADQETMASEEGFMLGRFLRALHVEAPADAPRNPFRGVPLRERADVFEERVERLRTRTDLFNGALLAVWEDALGAEEDARSTWIHGDLHSRNVLVEHERIAAVIDWGDLAAGDRATDLAALWTVLPNEEARRFAIGSYGGIPEATMMRARGWALLFASFLLDTGLADHPRHAEMGRRVLRNLDAEGT